MGTFVATIPEDHPWAKMDKLIKELPESEAHEKLQEKSRKLYWDKRAAETCLEFFEIVTVKRQAICAITGDDIPKGLKAIRIPNGHYRKGTTFISLHAIKRYGMLDKMKATMEEAEKEIDKIRAKTVVDPQTVIDEYYKVDKEWRASRVKLDKAIEKAGIK